MERRHRNETSRLGVLEYLVIITFQLIFFRMQWVLVDATLYIHSPNAMFGR